MTPSDHPDPRRGRPSEAHEDDPTGIRDLLAALPDPGPMPTDLVARIEARLAVEQAHRENDAQHPLAARSDSVVDLAAERSHRRPGRTVALLGVAAAGLLVATVAIGELGVGPAAGPGFDSAAQVSSPESGAGADSAEAGSDGAGGADEAQDDGGQGLMGSAQEDSGADGPAADADGFVEDLATDVLVLPELGPVSAQDYSDRILQLADAQRVAAEGESAPTPGGLEETQARWCWQAADPSDAWPTARAAEAEMDGQRVVVLLGTGDDVATGEAWVLPWSCTDGEDVAPLDAVSWAP